MSFFYFGHQSLLCGTGSSGTWIDSNLENVVATYFFFLTYKRYQLESFLTVNIWAFCRGLWKYNFQAKYFIWTNAKKKKKSVILGHKWKWVYSLLSPAIPITRTRDLLAESDTKNNLSSKKTQDSDSGNLTSQQWE